MNFFRIVSSIHLIFISGLRVPFIQIKLDNTLSSVASRHRIRKDNNGAISRGCNTCTLTQSAVSQGHSVCSAGAHVCVGWRRVRLRGCGEPVHSSTARLHSSFTCVTAGFSSGCTTMGDSFISGAPLRRCRPSEGESTNDVAVVVAPTSCFQTNQASSKGNAALSFDEDATACRALTRNARRCFSDDEASTDFTRAVYNSLFLSFSRSSKKRDRNGKAGPFNESMIRGRRVYNQCG